MGLCRPAGRQLPNPLGAGSGFRDRRFAGHPGKSCRSASVAYSPPRFPAGTIAGPLGHRLVHSLANDGERRLRRHRHRSPEPPAPHASSSPTRRTAGPYFSQPGDTGTLTADGHGGYLLTEADGTDTDYNANGTLNYIQDTDGNRITAGYTSGQLTSLTASSGQSFTIGYNAAGLISTVTDSQGRITTYLRSIEHVPDCP